MLNDNIDPINMYIPISFPNVNNMPPKPIPIMDTNNPTFPNTRLIVIYLILRYQHSLLSFAKLHLQIL